MISKLIWESLVRSLGKALHNLKDIMSIGTAISTSLLTSSKNTKNPVKAGLPFEEGMLFPPQQALFVDVLRKPIFNNNFLTPLPSHLTFREEADTRVVLFKG